ncbi:MAG TPA: toll/interleukin-1 receptor domain-containing protein [Pyrinomonadaceae bacterium]
MLAETRLKDGNMTDHEVPSTRDVIFISHAYPEDNEFTLWLALRLALEGYPVWCDLTKLLGGEDFWRSVEKIIRQKACKVLFVLSKSSNAKDGTLQEVALAKEVAKQNGFEDFLIPLKIDDLPRGQINIELKRINYTSFEDGWAKGLSALLEKLETQGVPKRSNYSPDAVASWWREHFSAEQGLQRKKEEHLSNWFVIESPPQKLFFHIFMPGISSMPSPAEGEAVYPYQPHGNGILSFAKAEDFNGGGQLFGDTHPFFVADLLDDEQDTFIDPMHTRDVITNLFTQAWTNFVRQRGLATYELASGAFCCYFKKDQLERDKITFIGVDDKKTWRNIIGYKSIKSKIVADKKRYWHFGISAKPHLRSTKFFAVNPHVLFSDDGQAIWDDKDRMHRVKMSQCKNWWNDDWRDRILAVMSWLTDENGEIVVPLSSEEALRINKSPLIFTSPVYFDDPGKLASTEDVGEAAEPEIDDDVEYDDEEDDDW